MPLQGHLDKNTFKYMPEMRFLEIVCLESGLERVQVGCRAYGAVQLTVRLSFFKHFTT